VDGGWPGAVGFEVGGAPDLRNGSGSEDPSQVALGFPLRVVVTGPGDAAQPTTATIAPTRRATTATGLDWAPGVRSDFGIADHPTTIRAPAHLGPGRIGGAAGQANPAG
jgi:hypothetical protein